MLIGLCCLLISVRFVIVAATNSGDIWEAIPNYVMSGLVFMPAFLFLWDWRNQISERKQREAQQTRNPEQEEESKAD